MTYTVGSKIVAGDYQGFRGNTAPNSAYADNTAATQKLAALIGVGYGSRGYGQTSTSFNTVVAGNTVTAAQWNTIRQVMSTINIHTGNGAVLQSNVSIGGTVQAFDGSSGRANIPALISTLDSARLTYDIAQMGLTSPLTSTLTTSWNIEVYHEFTTTFGSEDAARYFFNTGGTIYLAGSRSGGNVSALNTEMTNILSSMGTIKIGAQATTYTGTGGTVQAIGYYGLTGSYQTLFTIVGSPNGVSYTVKARAENIVGTNGGNGTVVRVQALFDTGHSSYFTMDGTLTSSISQLLAGGVLTVTAPTWATTHAL